MMKQADCALATALIIQGYMRANEEKGNQTDHLSDAVTAIRRECGDWAENLQATSTLDLSAIEPEDAEVEIWAKGAPVSRAPYSLVSAAIALLREAVDLVGPETVSADFARRGLIAARP